MKSNEFDAVVSKVLADWDIPGGALAVVRGEEVIARGYGVLQAGGPRAVDEHTVFAIGSTTKAFTAAAVAVLVDDGKLRWDDPVVQHLPDFRLHDEWISRQVTVRDLLCHRLGLERAQRLYYHQGYSQRDLMRRMQHLQPAVGFRTRFHYANQQYGVAGLIVEAVSGQTWDDFLTARLFQPLGMTRSASGYDRLADFGNLAQPHAVLDETYPAGARFLGRAAPIPWFKLSHEPSGSIHTSANDMLPWLRALLRGGAPLLQPASFAEITTPQVVMHDLMGSELAPLYVLQPGTRFWTYGLGWWVMDYRGEKVLMHGGQMPGFNSVVAFYPERNLGFAVLVNVHQTLAHAALFYALGDLLLDSPGRDWSAEFRTVAQGYMAQVKEQADNVRRGQDSNSPPPLPLEAYTGVFSNDLYGDMAVDVDAGRLRLRYGQVSATLEPCQPHTFLGQWNLKGLMDDSLVRFSPDARTMTLLEDQSEYLRQ